MNLGLVVQAGDGSIHTYPDGFTLEREGAWLVIRDENRGFIACFYEPVYARVG